MSFVPALPSGGNAGWAFLKRTIGTQKAAYLKDAGIVRDEDYFRQKIGSVKTASDLVADRRLLGVTLTAFGLEADINSKAFLRKILESATLDPSSLANKLADKRYVQMASTFGFGDFAVPKTALSDFAEKILTRFEARKFEAAVGDQNQSLRLALNAQRELPEISRQSSSADTKWFAALGSQPLREVIQTAFGLPAGFTHVDLDKQLVVLKERAQSVIGSRDLAVLSDPTVMEKLIRTYLARSEIQSGTTGSPGSAALSLLAGAASGPQGLFLRL